MSNNNYVKNLIESGMRIDNRKFDEFREIEIKTNIIDRAEGSSIIKIGNTQIIVGVKLSVGEPFPDTPDEGILIVNAEFSPAASPSFEAGPPDENAIELARVVDRAIRESHCIDLKKLCIVPKEKVWNINIDIQVIDFDGNLIDAACMGTVAALKTTKIPKYENDEVDYEHREGELPLVDLPIYVTIYKIGDKLFVDPTKEEEEAADARISIATIQDGKICAIQKGGTGYFTISEIERAIEMSIIIGENLRNLFKH
ncbi:MAG: exosome complex protein Rrp42 [Candidatus Aenigmatarchaeota archaeon]|nr:exosome complex protein Rrp42 [Candidatus Aenigmarchaeota archaeon]